MNEAVTVRTASGQHSFSCGRGERILHAGLCSGISLPYECATGTCGKCRAELIAGKVADLWPDAPGRFALRPRKREILMCQSARACGEVELAVSKLPTRSPSIPLPARRSGVLRRRRMLGPQIVEVGIQLDSPLAFLGGQFVLLEFADLAGPRAYSMVDFHDSTDWLNLIVRRKNGGGVSERLFGGDPIGGAVNVFGPLGSAVFEPHALEDVVCIGGGSGIAGMFSIARSALFHGHLEKHRLHFFFGVRCAADMFYAQELHDLRVDARDGFAATVAFSDAEIEPGLTRRYPLLRFAQGLVHEVAIRDLKDSLTRATTFLAGPPAAVEAGIRELITSARVPPNRIRFDKFS